MLFNSIDFAIFLPVVFFIYWFVVNKNTRYQNLFIVIASYFFYGWIDPKFLSLIIFSTIVDFAIGKKLATTESPKSRKQLLYLSLFVNLGFLLFFKYFNFFADNFVQAFSLFGRELNPLTLKILLPVGISFYTFQTLSYTIDVYRRNLEPTKDFISFAAYVSFFPQLVAGPIERATNLLPQFLKKRTFSYEAAIDGSCQILWGLVKKLIIADNCAIYANEIFNNSDAYPGSVLLLGALFFTFQIYGDFSGYSDIAIGTARLFGFNLMQNFATPYFSRDIAEFWRRWHISLSTWFRDYLYIPLGGSRGGEWMKLRNTFAIFLVSGFWHGANWTYIVWGGLNAIYFLPLLLRKKNRRNLDVVAQGKLLPSPREVYQMATTFILTVLAWIFFRADNVSHAINILSEIFSKTIISKPQFVGIKDAGFHCIIIFLFLLAEWFGRDKQYAIESLKNTTSTKRVFVFFLIIVALAMFMATEASEFIYFQF